jgi:hypothetical protein
MPLPGTRVIHDLWSQHHEPTALSVMTSTGIITRADGKGTTDANGTWTSGTRLTIYEGPVRVVRVAAENNHPVQGEERLTTRRYAAQIPASANEVIVGDSLEILTAKDPVMVGKKFRVEGIVVASEIWSRDMTVIEFEGVP